MFTGIVEQIGTVKSIAHEKNLSRLGIKPKKSFSALKLGSSIAINGVCLSVTKKRTGVLVFDVMKETLQKTTIGQLKRGSVVNLERALKANSRFDGHVVAGHIDQTTKIQKILKQKNYVQWQLALVKSLAPFIAPKGSICIDGVSLTVGEVTKNYFSVYLIPLTLEETTLGRLRKNDAVNIEVDLLARYVVNALKKK